MLGIPGPTIHPVRSQRQQSAHQSPGSPGDRLSLLQDGELIAPGLCLPVLVSIASLTAGTQSRSRQVSCEGVDRQCVVPRTGWQPPCCLPGPASSARTHSPSASTRSACSLLEGRPCSGSLCLFMPGPGYIHGTAMHRLMLPLAPRAAHPPAAATPAPPAAPRCPQASSASPLPARPAAGLMDFGSTRHTGKPAGQ